ncbi:energy-coupling factor ABC transporter permease, partial [Candidatus Bathyarchaeota archaeon]|nr:energy-coupling factor ABC transporter permease [Candidatus Bathyarchaeota archaeon]
GVAGFIGDLATYVTTAGQLALSLHPQEVIRYWGFFSMGFLPTQVPLAIIEFAVTAAIVRYIAISHPEVLGGMKKIG